MRRGRGAARSGVAALLATAIGLAAGAVQAGPAALAICTGTGDCRAGATAGLRPLEVLDPGGLDNPPWGIPLHTTGFVGGALGLFRGDGDTRPVALGLTWLGGGDAFFTNGFHFGPVDWFTHLTPRGATATVLVTPGGLLPFHFSVDDYAAAVEHAACNAATSTCAPTSPDAAGQFVSVGPGFALRGDAGFIGLGDGGGTRCDGILCDYQDATVLVRLLPDGPVEDGTVVLAAVVPEPASAALAAAGLALLGLVRRGRAAPPAAPGSGRASRTRS